MCICWKIRQRKLNIDDFGDPLGGGPPPYPSDADDSTAEVDDSEFVPGVVTTSTEDPIAVRIVLADALESATEGDLIPGHEVDEEARLLHRREVNPDSKPVRGWSAWFGR
jgi:hypothetical protein